MPRHAAMDRARRALFVAVGSIAGAQVLLGVAGMSASFTGADWVLRTSIPDEVRAIQILAFTSLAAYLLLGARRDPRVLCLGLLFLLTADSYAQPAIHILDPYLPAMALAPLDLVEGLAADAFMPWLVWLFFRDFPRALEWRRSAQFVRWMIGASLIAAVVLFAINVAIGLDVGSPTLRAFDKLDGGSPYWTIIFGLQLPVPPFVIWRLRHAPEDERRRVRLFGLGIALAAALPILYVVLPPLSDRIKELMLSEPVDSILKPLVQLMILSIPVSTTYAVVIHRVLDVGTVLRRAARYAIARIAVAGLAGIPLFALVWAAYENRSAPLSALLTGWGSLLIVSAGAAWFVVIRLRRGVMQLIDRLFERESYDSSQILVEVTDRSRTASSTRELVESLLGSIDDALHVESLGLLVRDPLEGGFAPVTEGARSLPEGSGLVARLSRQRRPIRTELERPSAVGALAIDDRIWLADGAVDLAAPLFGASGDLVGILTLGPKRSELPYSRDDLLLLSAIGSATGVGLENRMLRDSSPAVLPESEAAAADCEKCGRVGTADVPGACVHCGGALRGSRLPATLLGKFSLERRIGAGSMGLVYTARDLTLDRTVALKTLPTTSPEDSVRLRREARAMAAITHPNLALIFGAESWQGTPILVMEYLSGGTLEDRLASAPIGLIPALDLAITIAGVLDRAHRSGLLHRDVKPSNIGYDGEGAAKLLDFGLVRIAGELVSSTSDTSPHDLSLTSSGVVGTPLYMSPEALWGERPNASFDLWSLGVVAFEAATGRHPFEKDTPEATLDAIRGGWTSELAELLPQQRRDTHDLFEAILARNIARRPASALALSRLLESTLKSVSRLTPETHLTREGA